MSYTATLREGSPRADIWREMFGGTSIPIRSPIPEILPIHGMGQAWCYRVHLGELTPQQVDHLIAHFADESGESPDLVFEHLRQYGLPVLLGEDLDVSLGSVDLLGLLTKGGLVPRLDRELPREPQPTHSVGLFGPLGPRGVG